MVLDRRGYVNLLDLHTEVRAEMGKQSKDKYARAYFIVHEEEGP